MAVVNDTLSNDEYIEFGSNFLYKFMFILTLELTLVLDIQVS